MAQTVDRRRLAAQCREQEAISRNHFLLSASKYVQPYWPTMRQANELGGHVCGGEQSTIIVFWKVEDRRGEAEATIETEISDECLHRFVLDVRFTKVLFQHRSSGIQNIHTRIRAFNSLTRRWYQADRNNLDFQIALT